MSDHDRNKRIEIWSGVIQYVNLYGAEFILSDETCVYLMTNDIHQIYLTFEQHHIAYQQCTRTPTLGSANAAHVVEPMLTRPYMTNMYD